ILGSDQTVEGFDLEKRGETMRVDEERAETGEIEVLVLTSTRSSMRDKLPTIKEASMDLSSGFNARIGRNRSCMYQFPGKRYKTIQKVFDWSPKLDSVSTIFPKLTSGGITPTEPAIKEAIYQFGKKNLLRRFRRNDAPDVEEA